MVAVGLPTSRGHSSEAPGQLKKVASSPDTHSAKAFAPGQLRAASSGPSDSAPSEQVSSPGPIPLDDEICLPVADLALLPPAITVPVVPVAVRLPAADPVTVVASPCSPVTPAIEEAARHLRREGDRTSLIVRLDPPELGAVLVRLTVHDGQVDVTLRAPDAQARGDLLARFPDIQQVLRDAGLDLSSFDVSFDASQGQLLDSHPGESRQTPDRGTPHRGASADGSAPVTDDVDPQPAGTWL